VTLRSRLNAFLQRRSMRRPAGERLLRAFAESYPEAYFIEIGANDGEQWDHLRPFILSRQWRGIMVEPLPYAFERLRRNYDGLDRVALENVAIADDDGPLAFYYPGPLGAEEEVPEWYDGLGSRSRETLLRHADLIPDLERRIVRIQVPCMSFESLCSKHRVEKLDLLLIDTEGYEYEIVKRIDLEAHHPRVLVYEHSLLSSAERAQCRERVQRSGYATIEEAADTWCLDTGPDDRLSRKWRRLRPAQPGLTMEELQESAEVAD
jgi:FkbM family methyltransferase